MKGFRAVLTLLALTACADSNPEEARLKLGQLGLSYTKRAFAAAVENGDTLAVRLYVQAGMSPDDSVDFTPMLWVALLAGQPNILAQLLQLGANPHVSSIYEREPNVAPFFAAAHRHDVASVTALLEAGAQVEDTLPSGANVLLVALDRNYGGALDSTVTVLLKAGVRVNGVGSDWGNIKRVSPLDLAVIHGESKIVADLIRAGADVNYRAPEGETALFHAARLGRAEEFALLLTAGAQIDTGPVCGYWRLG